jgi:hypothetical protein
MRQASRHFGFVPFPDSCIAAKQGTIRFSLGQLRISREVVVHPSRTASATMRSAGQHDAESAGQAEGEALQLVAETLK